MCNRVLQFYRRVDFCLLGRSSSLSRHVYDLEFSATVMTDVMLLVRTLDARHTNVAQASTDGVEERSDECAHYGCVDLLQAEHLNVARFDARHATPNVAE